MRAWWAPLLVTAALLAGCGGGESEEDRAEKTLQDYWWTIDAGNGEKACEMLSAEKRQAYEGDQIPCNEFVFDVGVADTEDPDLLRRLAEMDYDVKIEGDRAEVSAERVGCWELVREEGDWKVTNLPCS